MRPYGMTRDECIEHPDVDDIRRMGSASHVGRLLSKSGEFDGYCTNPVDKARTRRHQKRNARREGKQSIMEQLDQQEP